jgi:hypothetical protein
VERLPILLGEGVTRFLRRRPRPLTELLGTAEPPRCWRIVTKPYDWAKETA